MAFYQEIYDSLVRETKLCIKRKKWRYGKPYDWYPRRQLVRRVAKQFGLSENEAFNRLIEIKQHIRRYPQYF
jgi:hypothetical protein